MPNQKDAPQLIEDLQHSQRAAELSDKRAAHTWKFRAKRLARYFDKDPDTMTADDWSDLMDFCKTHRRAI